MISEDEAFRALEIYIEAAIEQDSFIMLERIRKNSGGVFTENEIEKHLDGLLERLKTTNKKHIVITDEKIAMLKAVAYKDEDDGE